MKSAKKPADTMALRVRLAKDIADLTWRMFVPSIGGCVLGVVADRRLGTRPWLTLAGIVLGFAVVVFLVWRQIRHSKERV